jgi:uncharacterized tellurite resistance protein B-like protein
MTPIESLHFAMGELAYAVARADGTIQREEREKFHEIIEEEVRAQGYDFNVSDIIIQVLDREKVVDAETAYDWALKEMRINSHYLSPEMKESFTRIMEKIAQAYPPVTAEEQELVNRFKKDMQSLKGDPVYYSHH